MKMKKEGKEKKKDGKQQRRDLNKKKEEREMKEEIWWRIADAIFLFSGKSK